MTVNMKSFIILNEYNKHSTSDKKLYQNSKLLISDSEALKLYVKALNETMANIQFMIDKTKELNKLKKDSKVRDKTVVFRKEIAQKYDQTMKILQEFVKAFSITKDKESVEIMSMFYKSFNSIMSQCNLGFITKKPIYYNKCLEFMKSVKGVFSKLLLDSKHNSSSNNDGSDKIVANVNV